MSVNVGITEESTDQDLEDSVNQLQTAWDTLKVKVLEEFEINGFSEKDITFTPGYSMQYLGQLNDLEIDSPLPSLNESDATTFVVPKGFATFLDKHRLFHLIETEDLTVAFNYVDA